MKKLILAVVFILIAATSQAQDYRTYPVDIVGTWKVDAAELIKANHIEVNDAEKAQMIAKLENKFGHFSMKFSASGKAVLEADGETKVKPYFIVANTIMMDEGKKKMLIEKLDKSHMTILIEGMYMTMKKVQ